MSEPGFLGSFFSQDINRPAAAAISNTPDARRDFGILICVSRNSPVSTHLAERE
jgi:hypothetical protein